MNNKKLNTVISGIGCVLIILALILYMVKVKEILVYAVFSLGVVFQFIYKLRVLLEKKEKGDKYKSDLVILLFYLLMLVAVWML